jgi:subtilisin family serine protease
MLKYIFIMILLSRSIFANEIIIEVKAGYPTPQINGKIIEEFKVLDRKFIKIETAIKDPIGFYSSLKSVNHVDYNHETSIASAQDLSDFGKQWALTNKGNNEPVSLDRMSPLAGVIGADTNAIEAWKLEKGKKDVIIAVIDTGIDLKHPELRDNLWINRAELNGKKGVDDDGNGYIDDIHGMDFVGKGDSDPTDENGHGTHCAGIIGADHKTGRMAGIMENVQLMAVRHLNKRGAGKLDGAIKAIGYAIKAGAHILSNSWGSRGHSDIINSLLIDAEKKGIIVVAAAGNSRFNDNDTSPTYPANYDGASVISVSSMNAQARHAAYSSYGKKTVHVAAPGTNILSTYIKTRRHKKGYRVLSGTSMAAPYVSGIVGLFLSHYGDQYSPLEIRNRLIKTAVKNDELTDFNVAGGYVDAYNFLKN